MVDEAIVRGDGHGRVRKEAIPLSEWRVGGDQQRAALVLVQSLLEQVEPADSLVASAIRYAYTIVLAHYDLPRARSECGKIADTIFRIMAELGCLAAAPEFEASFIDRSLRVLQAPADGILAHQRAILAGVAARYCVAADLDAALLFDWGLEVMNDTEPLAEARGLIGLADGASNPRRVTLLARALEITDKISNEYVRADATGRSSRSGWRTSSSSCSRHKARRRPGR